MSALRRGDHGEAVRALQAALRGAGAALKDEPGAFGLWTEAAVYALQRGAGLATDGVFGPDSEQALRAAPPGALAAPTLTLVAGIPYHSQRNNAHRPQATCNVTALAMALSFFGVRPRGGGQLEDQLFELLSGAQAAATYAERCPDVRALGYPAYEAYEMLAWAAQQHGVPATFSTARSAAELAAEIAAGRPVLISGRFTGSGHIVLLIGLTSGGDLICHDPYGDWLTDYRSAAGEARIYPRARALPLLKPTDADAKWGLCFTAPGS